MRIINAENFFRAFKLKHPIHHSYTSLSTILAIKNNVINKVKAQPTVIHTE
jgi:hypothetical protein